MLAQNFILLALVYRHAPPAPARAAALWGAYCAAAAAYCGGSVPAEWVERAYGASNLLFWGARVPQIVANARAGSTGALSGLSTLLQCGGGAGACAARARAAR
jgi:mannose-P-dolichol utilization defect protein 1